MKSTQYPPRRSRAESEPLPAESSTVTIDESDELLEEIDGLLEDQEVLTNFLQRSGQ